LAAARGLSLPAIHRHIVILEEVGFVLRRKSGRTNFLALGRSPLLLVQEWISGFHAYWGSDGETLENYIDHLSRQPTLEGQE
jgi:DNA-binding transcriptional ArsR family regulator